MGGKVKLKSVRTKAGNTAGRGDRTLGSSRPGGEEAAAHAEEHESSPEADVDKGISHAHPVGHFLEWLAQTVLSKAAEGASGMGDSGGASATLHPPLVLRPNLPMATKFMASPQQWIWGPAAQEVGKQHQAREEHTGHHVSDVKSNFRRMMST
ncbi:hypothetical protein P7K49_027986 [Saguinus oedipus]|uniref:Uncharacterized protein n=1 Tax=Saguinus oedipus TaxID=9490 RepID=A0ABQ9UB02_SAGOE|nr:hypothetical protein P7K49_027986 [Saguinus oedipus]